MDLNPFIAALLPAIANDAAVDVLCKAAYGRSITVFGNYDVRNPPAAADCPCVCVFPSEKEYGGDTYADAIESVCLVHDDRIVTSGTVGTLVTYTGVAKVEDLRKLVLKVIARQVDLTADGQIDSISVDYDTISQFPFMTAAMAVAISEGYIIGSGNPADNE